MPLVEAPRAFFPPEVAIQVVRLACERPETRGRRLSQGECRALARQLIVAGSVADLSAATVRRILRSHTLQPWRHHRWLYPKKPREAACYAPVSELIERYTRPLGEEEIVLALWMRRPPDSLVPVGPQPCRPHPGTCPIDASTRTSAPGRSIALRPLIPAPARSLGRVLIAHVSRHAWPFWNSGTARLVSPSR
jgi:hypothetical protein